MNYISKYILASCMLVSGALMTTSCTDYLDKAPESDISETDAYKDFHNFQGFVEELYQCIPDFSKGYWTNSFNWGEDEIMNPGCNYHMCYKIDQGDFWGWQAEHDGWKSGWMDRNDTQPNTTDRFKKSLWPNAWYGIRKCNKGLANLELMIDGSQEQRDAIAGQLYFFRGWFHFMLIQYFGGLPYLDREIPASEKFAEPRLSYHECADKAAADFRKAADLLPINWDDTNISPSTKGQNELRINKIMALSYLGKNYLWAASPLMNKESTGSATYNKDYASKAADAFAEALNYVENGQTQYALVDFDKYSEIFYSYGQNAKLPGSTEAIFRGTVDDGWQNTRYGLALQFVPAAYSEGDVKNYPTANYVHYYGMANGLPLDDSDSGWDETHPWKDRDPRFYHDIRFDGVRIVSENASDQSMAHVDLQSGSAMRDVNNASRTGYLLGKFVNINCNKWDDGWGWSPQMHIYVSYMRLADVYLMYAEAAAQAQGSATGKSGKCNLTALDAVNKIRERAGVQPVSDKYTSSLDGFMSEVRRERAVELAFEGHRFNDLRRWLLLDKHPYTIKQSVEFVRSGELADDPSETAVSNYRYETILTRNFSEKHYWFPLKISDVSIYPEFYQNPGW